jgi:hypothetical protein
MRLIGSNTLHRKSGQAAFFVLCDENNAGRVSQENSKRVDFLTLRWVISLPAGAVGSLLLTLYLGPTPALSVGDGLASLGAEYPAGLCMGNSGGGGFAGRDAPALRQDGACLAKPLNLFIDGVQDLIVHIRSFRFVAILTG